MNENKNIISKITRLVNLNLQRFKRRSIRYHQARLAYKDAQSFIYKTSGTNTLLFDDQWELRRYCMESISPTGELFEFGVFKGESINFFAEHLISMNDRRTVYGFDSFKGFSENWSGLEKSYPVSHFDTEGDLPAVASNINLIDGYIEETLPHFLESTKINKIAFIHIDTDTYSPAKAVLENIKNYLSSGSIILFDELCGYPNWRNHEFKALSEALYESSYEYIGFAQSKTNGKLIKAAIRII